MNPLPQKHGMLSKHETVQLTQDAIVRTRDGVEMDRVAYEDIHTVHLKCDGRSIPHGGITVYRTVIKHAGGKFVFSNAIYGTAPEGMDDNYFDFVDRLHQQLRPHADRIEFKQGSSIAYIASFFGLAFGVLLVITIPALIIATGELEFIGKAWMVPLTGFMMAGVFVPLIKRGRKKPYGPDALPMLYLPH